MIRFLRLECLGYEENVTKRRYARVRLEAAGGHLAEEPACGPRVRRVREPRRRPVHPRPVRPFKQPRERRRICENGSLLDL